MRTEGDTWDISTGVGSTALFVAAARALAGRGSEPLAVEPYAEFLVREAGPEWADLLDGKMAEHPLLDPRFGVYFQLYQAARTKYFDDYFATAMRAGVRQIVILGAGLDARAYRLPWPDGTTIYELDRTTVLEFKRRALSSCGDEPRADRREVPVDLREDWSKILREHGFDPSEATAWLAEGLLYYLSAAAGDQLFDDIELASAPGSRVAIEEPPTVPDQAPAEPADRPCHMSSQPDWADLVYNEQGSDAVEWFTARGWDATGVTFPDYLDSLDRTAEAVFNDRGWSPSLMRLMTAVRPPRPISR
ncbi:SAM-dependent methyltransferase [Nocardia sp. NBC_01499]|uniref:SAM-dependent methyltransferase n=1 Tax=Nocardia sp. NBC_01499 TaxID=2903597 RepID=UPI00386FA9DC